MNRINPYMLSRWRLLYTRVPLCRVVGRYSSSSKIVLTKKHHYVATSVAVLLTATGIVAGGITFLDRTHRLQLFEHARSHKRDLLKEATWRDCLAVSLDSRPEQRSFIACTVAAFWDTGLWMTDCDLFSAR